MKIDSGIPFPRRKTARGIYRAKRNLKPDSNAAVFQSMKRGDSILFDSKDDATKFQAHVIRMFGRGRLRQLKYDDGTCRVWRKI